MSRERTKRFLLTGLAALLPTLLTLYLLYVAAIWIHRNIGSQVNRLLGVPEESWRIVVGDAVAFLGFLGMAWVAGFFLATYLGKMLFRRVDAWFRRIPLIRIVYPALRQVTDFFFAKPAIPFGRVVAVQYPRQGIYSIGFSTSAGLDEIRTPSGERLVGVFIPNTPAPLTGFTIFVPRDEVVPLSLTVDEAIKLIVSGGVVTPERETLTPGEALPSGPPGPVETGADLAPANRVPEEE